MLKFLRIAALSLLPFLTLLLGWQLGLHSIDQRSAAKEARMIEVFSGVTGSGHTVSSDAEEEVDIGLLWSVWNLLSEHYIDPSALEIRTMVFGAVRGMVASVGDPYTLFLTPDDSKKFQDAMSGTLEGIGAQLEMQGEKIVVVTPLKGSPAERAGLQPKDIIIAVDGQDITGQPLDAVVAKVRGPRGSTVSLTVLRATKKEELTIARESIHVPSIESRSITTKEGNIGYIALHQFGDGSIDEFKRALVAMPTNITGLVIDLRRNGGGYLEGAVQLTSLFVSNEVVVRVEHRGENPSEQRTFGEPLQPKLPLVVLIDGATASASEIVAGALQDAGRAKLVGVQSFGKGTVQELIPLPGGGNLRVTVARWKTPKGHDLSKKGISPDIVIEFKEGTTFASENDVQLQKALEVLKK